MNVVDYLVRGMLLLLVASLCIRALFPNAPEQLALSFLIGSVGLALVIIPLSVLRIIARLRE